MVLNQSVIGGYFALICHQKSMTKSLYKVWYFWLLSWSPAIYITVELYFLIHIWSETLISFHTIIMLSFQSQHLLGNWTAEGSCSYLPCTYTSETLLHWLELVCLGFQAYWLVHHMPSVVGARQVVECPSGWGLFSTTETLDHWTCTTYRRPVWCIIHLAY